MKIYYSRLPHLKQPFLENWYAIVELLIYFGVVRRNNDGQLKNSPLFSHFQQTTDYSASSKWRRRSISEMERRLMRNDIFQPLIWQQISHKCRPWMGPYIITQRLWLHNPVTPAVAEKFTRQGISHVFYPSLSRKLHVWSMTIFGAIQIASPAWTSRQPLSLNFPSVIKPQRTSQKASFAQHHFLGSNENDDHWSRFPRRYRPVAPSLRGIQKPGAFSIEGSAEVPWKTRLAQSCWRSDLSFIISSSMIGLGTLVRHSKPCLFPIRQSQSGCPGFRFLFHHNQNSE